MEILKESRELFDYTVSIRRKLHENPELSGYEFKTIKLICSELDKLGIPRDNLTRRSYLEMVLEKNI